MERASAWDDAQPVKNIEITITSVENIVRKDSISLTFTVEHNDVALGESSLITIDPDFREPPTVHNVDFIANFPVVTNDITIIESIVSTPILVKAVHFKEKEESSSFTADDGMKKKKYKAANTTAPSSTLFGICSLDLMPILLGNSILHTTTSTSCKKLVSLLQTKMNSGERCFVEKRRLESPQSSFNEESVSWQNLPLLTIMISHDDLPFFQRNEELNFLYVTIESIYNLPEFFNENLQYTAGTVLYTDTETYKNLIFENGTWTKYRDVERTKQWNSLCKLENRARLSSYKIDCDYNGIKNKFKKAFDLAKEVCQDVPRIEWNFMNRSLLQKTGAEAMEKQIARFKYWPFQFVISESSSETNKQKSKDKMEGRPTLYQCCADFSELLFPGSKRTRVVAQLYTYNPLDISEKTGLERNIFSAESEKKELKEKTKQNKASKHSQSIQFETEAIPSNPLTGENGKPTIVVIEVELYQPLIVSRVMEDFSSVIDQVLPIKRQQPRTIYSGDVADIHYTKCIQALAQVIAESYRDFCEEQKTISNPSDEPPDHSCQSKKDDLMSFTQYLYKTGVYLCARNSLRSKVAMLLDQKFKITSNVFDHTESQNFVASVYTYLVERMRIALNKIVEGRFVRISANNVQRETLHFYAEEAYELQHTNDAKYYYKTAIKENPNDPDCWTKYAVFFLKIKDVDRAIECCREALSLNSRDRIALLLYAGVLFQKHDYREAELFFRILAELYPRFTEAWAALHLFYIHTQYYPGVDLTLNIAEKCAKSKDRDMKFFEEEPLAWSMIHCPPDNVYLTTATLLLKLHLCDLAGIALAEEISVSNRSVHVLYYLAVEHYLSGRYENAMSHLEEAKHLYGMDYSIGSLMGHCLHQIGKLEEAFDCYRFVHTLFERPAVAHLVELRMGQYYQSIEDYHQAKRVFLKACKSAPTSATWLGAGISLYHLSEFGKAEAALSEANRINNSNPDVWAYLCLLNISLQRFEEFRQCYAEMVRNNLRSRKLWLTITKSMEAFGYTPPTFAAPENIDKDN